MASRFVNHENLDFINNMEQVEAVRLHLDLLAAGIEDDVLDALVIDVQAGITAALDRVLDVLVPGPSAST